MSRNMETCLKLKQVAETGSDMTSKKGREANQSELLLFRRLSDIPWARPSSQRGG
jgi:hypothetical protein